jgi:dihydroxyacetone kinase
MIKIMKHIAHHSVVLLEGFVGAGILGAAVAGSMFASPLARNVLHAMHCIAEGNEGKSIICVIF